MMGKKSSITLTCPFFIQQRRRRLQNEVNVGRDGRSRPVAANDCDQPIEGVDRRRHRTIGKNSEDLQQLSCRSEDPSENDSICASCVKNKTTKKQPSGFVYNNNNDNNLLFVFFATTKSRRYPRF